MVAPLTFVSYLSECRQDVNSHLGSLLAMTTTTTQSGGAPTFRALALPPARLDHIRQTGTDDGGNHPLRKVTAEGGEPVRCCLRIANPGEELLLIAYRPFDCPGPYAETGPVFIHVERCEGYRESTQYPEQFRGRPQVFRCYDAAGNIVGGCLLNATDEPEVVIAELFSEPGVERIHTRNVIYGCYMLEIASVA